MPPEFRFNIIRYTDLLDSGMYRKCHEPMLASMGMCKRLFYTIHVLYKHIQ